MEGIKFISKINQILFFLGACVLLFIVIAEFMPRYWREFNKDPGPEVIYMDQAKAIKNKSIKRSISHVRMIKNVHVFSVRSNAIIRPETQGGGMLNMFSMGYEDNNSLVNLIFLSVDDNQHLLFDKDMYINDYTLAEFDTTHSGDPYENYQKFSKNIYLVIPEDTDADGYITIDDSMSLYLSDFDGKNLKLIMKDIQRYTPLKDDLILIEKMSDDEKIFYSYDLANLELSHLEVKL